MEEKGRDEKKRERGKKKILNEYSNSFIHVRLFFLVLLCFLFFL